MAELAWMHLYLRLPDQGVLRAFPTDADCRARLAEIRWPNGATCLACGGDVWILKARPVYECRCCGSQPSVTKGTALAGTRIALRAWFLAAELVIEDHALRHRTPYIAGLERRLRSEGVSLSRKAVGRTLGILKADLAPSTKSLLKSALCMQPEPPLPDLAPGQHFDWLLHAVHQRRRNLSQGSTLSTTL